MVLHCCCSNYPSSLFKFSFRTAELGQNTTRKRRGPEISWHYGTMYGVRVKSKRVHVVIILKKVNFFLSPKNIFNISQTMNCEKYHYYRDCSKKCILIIGSTPLCQKYYITKYRKIFSSSLYEVF